MKLRVQGMWSAGLDPVDAGEGLPPDLTDFRVYIQAAIEEVGQPGHEVFGFTVCSPSQLARTESGTFVTATLVLERFSWEAIRGRLDKLLMHTRSAETWSEVIERLSGVLIIQRRLRCGRTRACRPTPRISVLASHGRRRILRSVRLPRRVGRLNRQSLCGTEPPSSSPNSPT